MEVIDPNPPAPPPGQDELPCEDGEPMETPRHLAQMSLLIETLKAAWSERDDYFVGGNMFVYFSELQSRGEHFRGPDFFVVLETERAKRRKSWVAWQEGGKLPDLVIELVSESTADTDRGEKKRIYERVWRTPSYALFDPETLELEVFELTQGGYARLAPDANGTVPITRIGLALAVRPGTYQGEGGMWLRLLDASGAVLPTQEERAEQATARADAATARADAATARADAAERALAELQGKRAGR